MGREEPGLSQGAGRALSLHLMFCPGVGCSLDSRSEPQFPVCKVRGLPSPEGRACASRHQGN